MGHVYVSPLCCMRSTVPSVPVRSAIFFSLFFLTDKEAFYPLLLYITELPGVIVK